MGLLCQPSGKAALDFVRKYICPLPAPSSTRKKYVHMHGLLGTFRPAYQYLSVKLPQMDEYYRICSVVFDEMKITKTCQIDTLFVHFVINLSLLNLAGNLLNFDSKYF